MAWLKNPRSSKDHVRIWSNAKGESSNIALGPRNGWDDSR
jgi:hypothetical protein